MNTNEHEGGEPDLAAQRDLRLAAQMKFIEEADKAKQVLRQTVLMDGSRRENDAEHSWHLCLMAMLLHEYAAGPVDLLRVIKMLLVHDLVEIDAGDTFVYDAAAQVGKADRERKAADRIFGMLPGDQAEALDALWTEFEARETAEARFAASLDRFQPLLHNYRTQGHAWRQHAVRRAQVVERNRHIDEGAPVLWREAARMIAASVERGYLQEG